MSMIAEHDNVVVWFEIPAADFDRAATFYETIFDTRLNRETFGGPKMGVFSYDRPKVSGCVMEAPERAGKDAGTVDLPQLHRPPRRGRRPGRRRPAASC